MRIQTTETNRPLISEGQHILTLKSVMQKRVKSQFSEEADGMTEKLLWNFESATCDPNGSPYAYTVFTNLVYGSDKASLTALLDMMIPGLTRTQAAQLDTADLVDRRYRTRITHKATPAGKVVANHLFIEPLDEGTPANNDGAATQTKLTAPVSEAITHGEDTNDMFGWE